jgi:threonine dehydratase
VLPFEILRGATGPGIDGVLTASDAELVDAMRVFAGTLKIVVEPTGCLGFAAVRRLGAELAGQRVGVVISGGNVDLARFGALLADR